MSSSEIETTTNEGELSSSCEVEESSFKFGLKKVNEQKDHGVEVGVD